MKRLFFLAAYVGFVAPSFALPNREVPEFSMYWQQGGKIQSRTFRYEELKSDLSFKAKSPHGMLNPEGKITDWSGVSFRWLFKEIGKSKLPAMEEVVVVGFDGYQSQMFFNDFFDPDAMIATHNNGERILPSKGGPQSFFPNQDPKLRKELIFEGWGTWYVSAIIIGSLKTQLDLLLPSGKQITAKVTSAAPEIHQGSMRLPPGHYRAPFKATVVNASAVDLQTFLKTHVNEPYKTIAAKTYYGETVPITGKVNEYELHYEWNGKPLAPKLGGPVQLCPKGKAPNCLFFLKSFQLGN